MDQTNQQGQEQTVEIQIPGETVPPVDQNPSPSEPSSETPVTQPQTAPESPLVEEVVSKPIEKEEKRGRPCIFCSRRDEIMRKTDLYIAKCEGKVDGKLSMPWLEELALILDVDIDTVTNWYSKRYCKDDSHDIFLGAKKKIFDTMQLLRLKQRALGIHNAAGSIFLMKANHGMIETEKQILAGDKQEPLTIEIVEAKHDVEES